MRSRRWTWWLAVLLLFAAGLVLGGIGAFLQAQRIVVSAPWGPTMLPWGLVLMWLVLILAVRGGAWMLMSRWGAWSVAVGWLTTTVLLSAESPSGDVALSGGGRQVTYLLGGVILASAAATLQVPRRHMTEVADSTATTGAGPEERYDWSDELLISRIDGTAPSSGAGGTAREPVGPRADENRPGRPPRSEPGARVWR